jgi:predicted nucleic acid-binding protein
MTVIVDTGVLYADHDTNATRHEAAKEALESVYGGELGMPYVSDYIYDETMTLTRTRGDSFEPAKRLGEKIRGVGEYPDTYEMLYVSAPVFVETVELFEKYDDQELSVTDASTVALYERHDIDTVLSFDDDFDSIVDRVDPEIL